MNAPKLRFKEFNDEWKECSLGNISNIKDGTHNSPRYVKNGYPLITSKNLTEIGKLDFSKVKYIKKEDYDKINEKAKVDIGDIIFGMIGTIGKPVKIDNNNNFAIKNVCLIKEKNEIINDYLIHYLKSNNIQKQFLNNLDGGTQKFISLSKIRNLKVNIPTIKERKKLVKLFDLLNKKIELQLQKIEKLYLYKKCISKNLLLDNLNNFQEIKLKNICDISTGKLDANAMNKNGKYRFYTCAKDYYYINEYAYDTEALLISGNGYHIGYIHYYKGKFNAFQRTYVLTNFKHNIKYIQCFLDYNLPKRINNEKKKSNTNYIVKETLTEMNIRVPNEICQKKIANTICALADKITLEENKLKKIEQLKKGLMQKMFV